MRDDDFYMKRALELALKAEGQTSPNPLVGAVIVKDGVIVGEGYHRKAGMPHAEALALRRAGKNGLGATLYVTLEPCDHYGRTPPCTRAIIESRIKRVVIASKDPNPVTNGRGIKKLKKHGIIVKTGVLSDESEKMNAAFTKFIRTGIPYVTLKMGESLDGKIATAKGESKWITCPASREYVQVLRAKSDAVLTGINTVLADDPFLLPRIKAEKKPARVIVDSRLSIPIDSQVLKTAGNSKVIIAATKKAPVSKIVRLKKIKGVEVIFTGIKNGRVDLAELMKELGKRQIMNVLVEGGHTIAGSMLDEKLVDRVYFFIAPVILGGDKALSSVGGKGAARLADAVNLGDIEVLRIGMDILISGVVVR